MCVHKEVSGRMFSEMQQLSGSQDFEISFYIFLKVELEFVTKHNTWKNLGKVFYILLGRVSPLLGIYLKK